MTLSTTDTCYSHYLCIPLHGYDVDKLSYHISLIGFTSPRAYCHDVICTSAVCRVKCINDFHRNQIPLLMYNSFFAILFFFVFILSEICHLYSFSSSLHYHSSPSTFNRKFTIYFYCDFKNVYKLHYF